MPSFDDYRNIDIDIDGANDWIPEVRLSGGDVDGRTITVRLLKDGKVIDDPSEPGTVSLTARLVFNPKVGTAYPGGYKTMDKFVQESTTGGTTWGFKTTVPRAAFTNLTGHSTAMAIEVQKTTGTGESAKDEIVCSRTFNAIVDESVLKAGDGTDPDPLEEWHDLINHGDDQIQDMVDRGNAAIATFNTNGQNAIDGVNTVKNDMQSLVDGANIAAGTVTELKPNEAPSFELTGDKWDKTMNLGLPRGASIASITATTLQAGQQATVTSNKNADGDYNVEVGLPTGPQGVDGFPVFVFTSVISSTSTDYSIAKDSGNISPGPDIDTNYTNKAFIMDADGSVFLVFLDDNEGLHVNGSQRILSLKGPAGEGLLVDSTRGLVSSDAGVAINLSADNPGLEFDAAGGLKATAQTVGDATRLDKGVVQISDGLNVRNGKLSFDPGKGLTHSYSFDDQFGDIDNVSVNLPSGVSGLRFTDNNELEVQMVEPPSWYGSVPLARTGEGPGILFDSTKGLTGSNNQLALAPATTTNLGGVSYDDKTIRMKNDSQLFASIGCVSKVTVNDSDYYNIAPKPLCINSDNYANQFGVWFGFYVSEQAISFNGISLEVRMVDGYYPSSSDLSNLASNLTDRTILVEDHTVANISTATAYWNKIDLTLDGSLTISKGPHWFEVQE